VAQVADPLRRIAVDEQQVGLAKAPPNLRYFIDSVARTQRATPEGLDSKSILVGSPEKITAELKGVEASGISEVILYFNYGRKPHAMVKEQMRRFAHEIAPRFASGVPASVGSAV